MTRACGPPLDREWIKKKCKNDRRILYEKPRKTFRISHRHRLILLEEIAARTAITFCHPKNIGRQFLISFCAQTDLPESHYKYATFPPEI